MSDVAFYTQPQHLVVRLMVAMVAMPLLSALWMIHVNVSLNSLQGGRDRLTALRERMYEVRPPTVASLALAEELTIRCTISELLDELEYEKGWYDHADFMAVRCAAERGIHVSTTAELAAHLDAVFGEAVHRSRAAAGIAQWLLLGGCLAAVIAGLAVWLILRQWWLAPATLRITPEAATPPAAIIGSTTVASATIADVPASPPVVFRAIPSAAAGRGSSPGPGQQLSADGPWTPLSGRVLVIEDNPINQRVTQRQLMELGMGVEVVDSAESGLQRLMQTHFDVVLMDLQLPGIDGLTATRQWRAREEAEGRRRTPIIAITANATGSDREACYSAGMDGYQAKPARLGDLHRVLMRWVGSDKTSDAANEKVVPSADEEVPLTPTPQSQATSPVADSSMRSRLLEKAVATALTDPQLWATLRRETAATDPRMLEELIADLRAQAQVNLSQLDDAFAAGEHEHLRAAAHRLKGSAGMLGLPRLAACAKAIEFAAKVHDNDIAARALKAVRKAYTDTLEDTAVRGLV